MKAHEVLKGPSDWCKGQACVDEHGNEVEVDSDRACRFCVFGALIKAHGAPVGDFLISTMATHLGLRGPTAVFEWNDAPERTFNEVRDVLLKLDI